MKKDIVIYKITNLLNGKIYVGQTSRNNSDYFGSRVYFSRVFKKYKKENFKKEILEHCKIAKELNEREIYWISKLDSMNPKIGYNLIRGGESILGFKFSEESRKKISKARKGRKVSEKQKEKLVNLLKVINILKKR